MLTPFADIPIYSEQNRGIGFSVGVVASVLIFRRMFCPVAALSTKLF